MKNIFTKYRLNHNQKIEAEEIINELILQNPEITLEYFEQFSSENKQISDAFITWLRKLRYPKYSAYHKTLSSLLKAIHNNNSIFRVVYNDNFESDEYEVVFLDDSLVKQKAKLDEKKEYLNKLTALIKNGNIL